LNQRLLKITPKLQKKPPALQGAIKSLNGMGQQWQEGACLYFNFHKKWSKYGIQVLLGPKNVEAEKRTLIAQVLAFKIFFKNVLPCHS
jgi:hypothetical protein